MLMNKNAKASLSKHHVWEIARAACVAVLSFLGATLAVAAQQTGTIVQLYVRASDGLVYFTMSGSPSARPTCATSAYWMIKDESSAAGKRQIAMLLAARATSQSITVFGANTCVRWGDSEDVNEIAY